MVEIKLEEDEVKFLRDFVKKGRKSARGLTKARILLLANQQKGDTEIAETLDVGRNTVWRTKKKYRKEGLQSALAEKPKQHIKDKRTSIPMKSGSPEKYDYEYIRNGTANIFMAVEFKAGKRVTQVTKRRTMVDFAQFVKMLVDEEYPDVKIIRMVMDNLNTHKEKSFYEAFRKDEAERILGRIEFHYTPKHASWLNAAEIEINVMDIECTDRRIGDMEILADEVAAWTQRRNNDTKKINWKFTSENADEKLSKHYVP